MRFGGGGGWGVLRTTPNHCAPQNVTEFRIPVFCDIFVDTTIGAEFVFCRFRARKTAGNWAQNLKFNFCAKFTTPICSNPSANAPGIISRVERIYCRKMRVPRKSFRRTRTCPLLTMVRPAASEAGAVALVRSVTVTPRPAARSASASEA